MCVFLEPIALYHTRDLHEDGDGLWLAPAAGDAPLGSARTYGDGGDLTILTWANGLRMSLRVARALEARGVRARVVDLRWLAPLPLDDLLREASATGRVLVVDETRRSGGVSEGVLAALVDAGFDGRDGAGRRARLVRSARRRGEPRAALRGRDRDGGARALRVAASGTISRRIRSARTPHLPRRFFFGNSTRSTAAPTAQTTNVAATSVQKPEMTKPPTITLVSQSTNIATPYQAMPRVTSASGRVRSFSTGFMNEPSSP